MAGVKMTFCMYLSMVGAVFFFFLAICCFVGMEALHLPKGKKVQRGMEVFAAGLIYAGIAAYIMYKKYLMEQKKNPYQNQSNPDEELKAKLMQDYN